jgi:hypothetical protein
MSMRLSHVLGPAFCVFSTAISTGVHGQVIAGVNSGIPLQVYDTAAGAYVQPMNLGLMVCKALAADDAGRRLYLSDGARLFMVPYDPPHTPVLLANFSGDVLAVDGGLAFDADNGRLLATASTLIAGHSDSLFEVNPQTGAVTFLRSLSGFDFGGIDIDAATGVMYLANDRLTTRGVYSLSPPYETSQPVFVVGYPQKAVGQLEHDIDGLAAGGGRVYLIADETNWMYRYDLASGQYLPPVAQTAFGPDRFSSGGAYAPGIFSAGVRDAALALTAPPLCDTPAGGEATLSARVRSEGNASVRGVSLRVELPALLTLVDSQPAAQPAGPGAWAWSLGAIAPGAHVDVAFTVRIAQSGQHAVQAQVTTTDPDPTPQNNLASAFAGAFAPPVPARIHRAVVSTVPGTASAQVPGLTGAQVIDAMGEGIGRPSTSADGRSWILPVRVAGAQQGGDVVLLLERADAPLFAAAREGAFPAIPGPGGMRTPVRISARGAVNDRGDWAMAGDDGRAGAGGFAALVWDDGTVNPLLRQGTGVPGLGAGETLFGSEMEIAGLGSDGGLTVLSTLSGPQVTPQNNLALVTDFGLTILARTGETVPLQQTGAGGVPTSRTLATIGLPSNGGTSADQWWGDAVLRGTLSGPGTHSQIAASATRWTGVEVLAQDARPLPSGLGAGRACDGPAHAAFIESHGARWLAVSFADGDDWLIKDNAAVWARGGDVPGGGGLRWSDVRTPASFLGAGSNAGGQVVIVGATDAADALADEAAALDGSGVLARENDGVDLDGDGEPDAYIAGFVPWRAAVLDDSWLGVVRLRSAAAAAGCGADAVFGHALLRIDLNTEAVCYADFNQDGGVDGADVEAFFLAWEAGESAADVNGDGGVDGGDVETFFIAWEAGECA